VFLFFVHVALAIAQEAYEKSATGTTPLERVRAALLGRERGYLASTIPEVTAYERIGLVALAHGVLPVRAGRPGFPRTQRADPRLRTPRLSTPWTRGGRPPHH
jgi:hypothetical protein